MDKQVLDKLFESLGITEKLQSDEVRAQTESLIQGLVEARAKALAEESAKNEATLLEAAADLKKQFEEKENILKTEAANFAKELAESMAAKEAIMMEEINSYRQEVEDTIRSESSAYRESLEKIVAEEAAAYKANLESIVMEEAGNYKKSLEAVVEEEAANFAQMQEQTLQKEVGTFKEEMVDKVSAFLESELKTSIPESIMESANKLAAYEPLVEGIVATFGKNYIKLDDASYKLVKEAKQENERLSESVNAKTKDNVNLTAEVQELKKKAKLFELTEGLTVAQRRKAQKVLESYKAEEMEERFNSIKDIILAESTSARPTVPQVAPKQADKKTVVLGESAQKKVERLKAEVLTEGVTSSNPEVSEWASTLNRQIRMSKDI
jgi:hypothetical protein